MKILFLSRDKAPVHYPYVWLRFVIAVPVSVFLLIYGEPEGFWEFFELSFFYDSLWGSYLMTVIISEFIYVGTKWLDFRYRYTHLFKKRLLLQFLVCVLLPAALDYILAGYYFDIHEHEQNMVEFLTYDYTVAVCFILLLNAYYLNIFLYQTKTAIPKKRLRNRRPTEVFIAPETIAVIFAQLKSNYTYDFTGKKESWNKTLKDTLLELDSNVYFQINRSDIVHRASVIGHKAGDSRTLVLDMKIPVEQGVRFVVSQRRVAEFKRWYREG
ncbi:MAG: LytTR family transcriptional regulator [Flavobacteriales bacterium]|nr:MAG: LytTR family transcriptional regulator [Flavobacteriales bacterium]